MQFLEGPGIFSVNSSLMAALMASLTRPFIRVAIGEGSGSNKLKSQKYGLCQKLI